MSLCARARVCVFVCVGTEQSLSSSSTWLGAMAASRWLCLPMESLIASSLSTLSAPKHSTTLFRRCRYCLSLCVSVSPSVCQALTQP